MKRDGHYPKPEEGQIEVERTRRIAAAWHAEEPTREEMAAARVRFATRARTGRQARVAPGVVAAAIVLTGAAAFASTRVIALRTARLAVAAAERDPSGVEGRSRPPVVKRRGVLPSKDDTTPLPASSARVVAVEDLPVARPPLAPQALPVQPRVASPEVRPSAPPPSGKLGSGWIDAAAALRAGDYARAEQMFGEIARSPDARTRDEARLARAQVWLAQGRRSEAEPELEDLAGSGATPLVRQRAAQAIAALP
jgi:hypothetical protein